MMLRGHIRMEGLKRQERDRHGEYSIQEERMRYTGETGQDFYGKVHRKIYAGKKTGIQGDYLQ